MEETIKKIKEKIPKALRNAVWNHNIGNNKEGECYVGCGEKISINNFACGHIISEKNGGKAILDNLKPICVACNSSMGKMNMNDFINKYGFKNNIIHRPKDISIKNIKCEDKNNIMDENDNISMKNKEYENDFDLKILKIKELQNICDFYEISYKNKHNKSELIDKIKNIKTFNYYDYLKKSLKYLQIKDLKNICENLDLSKNGKKNDLIDKIVDSNYIIEITDYIDCDMDTENDKISKNLNVLCIQCLRYGHNLYQCNYKTISHKLPFEK